MKISTLLTDGKGKHTRREVCVSQRVKFLAAGSSIRTHSGILKQFLKQTIGVPVLYFSKHHRIDSDVHMLLLTVRFSLSLSPTNEPATATP